jgi:hypothetical protein
MSFSRKDSLGNVEPIDAGANEEDMCNRRADHQFRANCCGKTADRAIFDTRTQEKGDTSAWFRR